MEWLTSGRTEPIDVEDDARAAGADAPVEAETVARRIAELSRTREAAVTAAAAERERNERLLQQCDELAAELFAWRRRCEQATEARAMTAEEARKLALRLQHALATIHNMERSWFWRMRLACVRLRGLLR